MFRKSPKEGCTQVQNFGRSQIQKEIRLRCQSMKELNLRKLNVSKELRCLTKKLLLDSLNNFMSKI